MRITDWPEEERPCEWLLKLAAASLSEAELLAIFRRSGVAGKSAVEPGRDLLGRFGGLHRWSRSRRLIILSLQDRRPFRSRSVDCCDTFRANDAVWAVLSQTLVS